MKIDNVSEVKETLSNIKTLFEDIDDLKKELERKIKQKEAEQDDYLHEIELGNLNGIDLVRAARKLKEIRKERRIFKDKLELINTLKGYTDKFITKGIIADTNQVISNIDSLLKNQENRYYTPKVAKNLKCAQKIKK